MKRLGLLGVYEAGLLAVLLLIVLHAPLSVAFGMVLPEFETLIKAWKEILLTLLALIAVVLVIRRGIWTALLRDRLVQLALGFIVLHLVLAVLLSGDLRSIVAGLMIDLRFVAMLLLVYVLIRLRPSALGRVLRTTAFGAVIVIGFGLLQITLLPDDVLRPLGYSKQTITPYTTIDQNPEYVRINSTLRGPNPLGALMVIYGSLLVAYLVAKRKALSRKYVALSAGLVSTVSILFASYSRSAYLAFLAAVGLAAILAYGRIGKKFIIGGVAAATFTLIGLGLVSTTDWYSNVILHEDPESTVVAKSNEGHVDSLADGARRFVAQPFGAGIGSTGSASLYDADASNDVIIENYYFFVAHETGWLGLALFVGLFGIVLVRLWHRRTGWAALGVFSAGIGLALVGVLLPVWVDETVALIWWGLAGALIAPTDGIIGGRYATRARKQASTGTA